MTSHRYRLSALAPALAALVGSTAALAAPARGGTPAAGSPPAVQGVVVASPKTDAPPPEHLGFVPPIENPILEPRPFDPLPECFVFLDGGPVADDAGAPAKTPVVWQLGSHSFAPPLLPVVGGSTVEIANVGRETHILYSPTTPNLLPRDPIGPGTSRTAPIAPGTQAVVILAEDSPHVRGRVIPLATRYFARVDRTGKFRIDSVPAGHWTLRVWYRDGWLGKTVAIDVPTKTDVRFELPDQLATQRPPPK